MTTLYVTGIPIFLYALGVSTNPPNKVVLVKILEDSQRAGIRPFDTADQILTDICLSLGFDYEMSELETLCNKLSNFENDDLVDCQILFRGKWRSNERKYSVLALQHEYVNFKRPSIFKGYSPSFRKRVDFIRKLVIPFKLYKYYGLAVTPKPKGLLKELPINHYQVKLYRNQIFQNLANIERYEILSTLKENFVGKKVCIVFPFAKHWGGSDELNAKLFALASQEYVRGGFEKLLIKNHPSDPQDYFDLIPPQLNRDDVMTVAGVFERTIPIEIMVEAFSSYRFMGTESTAFMTLSPFVSDPTIIVDSELQISRRYQSYVSGETRRQYSNVVVRI